MSRIWKKKMGSLNKAAKRLAGLSPVLTLLSAGDNGEEWRSLWEILTTTLVRGSDNRVGAVGPVTVGIRYHESFVSQAPHPVEIVTILEPFGVYHPNVTPGNALCLGHPEAGLGLDSIMNQTWAGLTLNMNAVATGRGDIYNPAAAHWVRANANRLPLTPKGLFEEPDFDPQANSALALD